MEGSNQYGQGRICYNSRDRITTKLKSSYRFLQDKDFSKLRKHRQKTNDFYNYVHVISESSYYAFFQLGNLKHVHYYPQNFSTVNDVVYSKIS